MKIYNAITKTKEEFKPIVDGQVSMYHCGPTVYDYIHIGNLRSFMLGDIIRRSFEYLGFETKQVMNITDVGHLVSDGDDGDDKMTKALKRHEMDITLENMLKVADIYSESFKTDLKNLNILTPHHLPKASDHIPENIVIIEKLFEKGFAYTTSDGVYFDTKKMPDYGKLGGLNLDAESESRIETNSEKRFHADFALWKFDEKNGWDSPWGHGFPGWHIECSGMSMKYLGETFDIHTGGYDNKSVHHNNEIAQSECSTGKTFVNYWLHGEFLNLDGEKLSKSTGGNITLMTLFNKGFSPLDLRYLYLQSIYRSQTDFTWEIIESSKKALDKIYRHIEALKTQHGIGKINPDFQKKFSDAISDDFNLPIALSIFHNMMKSDISAIDKLATAYNFDTVLGLDLEKHTSIEIEISDEVQTLLNDRKIARENKDWESSDQIRDKIMEKGFKVSDINGEQKIETL
ncbi:MAG: cysteine--tRNA ligase [Candidatus Pacebacteria bacterium]|nr:cysteine--tRNA ligase [Candidatus Paceibacterota bacterium]